MRTLQWNPFLISFLLSFILVAAVHATAEAEAEEDSPEHLRLELVHRHDPRLPGNKNLELDKFEAIRERALRAVARKNRKGNSGMIQMLMRTGWDYLSSEYFVQVRVGTPSQNFWLVADTGSELTWFRCNDQNPNMTHGPTRRSALRVKGRREFYPRLSRTYQPVTCADPRCQSDEFATMMADPLCELPTDFCPYEYE